MKTYSFSIKKSIQIKAAVGRDMAGITSAFPAVFAGVDKVCIVTDCAALKSLKARAAALFPVKTGLYYYELPRAEKAKALEQAGKLCSFLFTKGFSRNSLIIAAGGGAVTDLAGFAASIYMRGIKWVSAPTTFLGQIDAGLGGKTGVNLGGAKNIAGTFHQPALTVCDTAFLDSLPHAELRSGAGELAKYAMIGPRALRRLVENSLPRALVGDKAVLTACVAACAAYKLKLVAADERDENGVRESLNLGHTAGHAFEAMARGKMPHGEAVGRGLRFVIILSGLTGRLKPAPAAELLALVGALRLPPPPAFKRDFNRFLSLVSRDKKARGASSRFILLRGPGRLESAEDIKPALLRKAFEGALA